MYEIFSSLVIPYVDEVASVYFLNVSSSIGSAVVIDSVIYVAPCIVVVGELVPIPCTVGGPSESPTKRALLFESVKLKSACAVNWGNLQFFITQSLGNYSIRFKLPLF